MKNKKRRNRHKQKAAKKIIRNYVKNNSPDTDTIKKLNVQTMAPLTRFFLVALSTITFGGAIYLISIETPLLIIIALFVLSTVILLIALFGKKESVDSVIEESSDHALETIVESIAGELF